MSDQGLQGLELGLEILNLCTHLYQEAPQPCCGGLPLSDEHPRLLYVDFYLQLLECLLPITCHCCQ